MSKFFLYNGVELPALPEWDKTVYPYAFIYIVTLDGTTGVYTLVVSSSSVMGYDGNGIICPSATVGQRYTVSEDSWAAASASDDFYIKRDNLIYTVWANFDVLNSDGSVYVAASEPVPVAGKFPLREWVGWLIAGLCSRPLPVRMQTNQDVLDNEWPIEWSTIATANNSVYSEEAGIKFIKISDLTLTLEEVDATTLIGIYVVDGESIEYAYDIHLVYPTANGNCIYEVQAVFGESFLMHIYLIYASIPGAQLESLPFVFPEAGIYYSLLDIEYNYVSPDSVDLRLKLLLPEQEVSE